MLSQKYWEWEKLDLVARFGQLKKKTTYAYPEGCLKFYISEGRI